MLHSEVGTKRQLYSQELLALNGIKACRRTAMLANEYHTEDNDRSCRRSGENGTTVGTVLKRPERIGTSVTFLAVVVRAPPVSWGSQSEGPVHRGRAGTAE